MREIKDVRIICVWHEIGEVRLCCTLRARLTFDTVYVQGAMTLSYIWLYLKKPVSPGSTVETGFARWYLIYNIKTAASSEWTLLR